MTHDSLEIVHSDRFCTSGLSLPSIIGLVQLWCRTQHKSNVHTYYKVPQMS